MNKYLKGLWEVKEGLIFGGLVGYVAGRWILAPYFDLGTIAQTQSVLDFLKTASESAIEFAKDKIIIACIVLGAIGGATIDSMVPEKRWRLWK